MPALHRACRRRVPGPGADRGAAVLPCGLTLDPKIAQLREGEEPLHRLVLGSDGVQEAAGHRVLLTPGPLRHRRVCQHQATHQNMPWYDTPLPFAILVCFSFSIVQPGCMTLCVTTYYSCSSSEDCLCASSNQA